MQRGDMPFLRRLQEFAGYELRSLFPGIPCSTPVVQAAFLYGVPRSLPGYWFHDTRSGEDVGIDEPGVLAKHEQNLAAYASSWLRDEGASISNLYTAEARHVHGCFQTLDMNNAMAHVRSLGIVGWGLAYLPLLPSLTWRMLRELTNLVPEAFNERNPLSLRKVLAQIGKNALAVDLARVFTKMHVASGTRAIHTNFISFDGHSHVVGPKDPAMLRVTRQLDNAVRQVVDATRKHPTVAYEVLILSDHGHEVAKTYEDIHGFSLEEKIATFMDERGVTYRLVAEGPTAHLYVEASLSSLEQKGFVRDLLAEAYLPAVLAPGLENQGNMLHIAGEEPISCRTELPKRLQEIEHPFPFEAAADLDRALDIPNAGSLLLLGWHPCSEHVVVFSNVNGTHGGPGTHECHAFALVPPGLADVLPDPIQSPTEIHRMASDLLHRSHAS